MATVTDSPQGASAGGSPSAPPAGARQQSPGASTPKKSRRLRIPRKEVVSLTTQLAIMIRAGVDVSTALQSTARRCRRPAMRSMLEDIHDTVIGGSPLSEAMQQYVNVFGETFTASVAAGEASGRLPEVLGQLATMERSSMRLRGAIRTMMAYPILLMSVSGLVLAALIMFVLPQFAAIFKQFDMPLPAVTQLLIGFSTELRLRWWLWFPLLFGVVGGLVVYRRTKQGKAQFDWLAMYVVLIRDVTRNLAIGRVCRLLGIMLESGVPLLDSIRLARTAATNTLYKNLFSRLEEDVLNGRGMGNALLTADFIPDGAADMLITSERTGAIGPVTQMIGEFYEEEGEMKLKEIVTLLEPAITVGMGVIIAIVVSAVMLPMFDMAQISSGGH